LTEITGWPFAVGTDLYSMATDSGSHFLCVANLVSGTISAFIINSTSGSLSAIASYSAGTNPISVAVDKSGKHVYVANFASSNVSAFSIDSTSGVLTQISGSPFGAGTMLVFAVVDASGKFLCKDNQASKIYRFSIDSSIASRTAISGSPYSLSSAPSSMSTME